MIDEMYIVIPFTFVLWSLIWELQIIYKLKAETCVQISEYGNSLLSLRLVHYPYCVLGDFLISVKHRRLQMFALAGASCGERQKYGAN